MRHILVGITSSKVMRTHSRPLDIITVAVVVSRDFKDLNLLKKTLSKLTITVIVSGGALGADLLAERYADENNIPKIFFWKTYGKIAGF
jgi:hypothetical protein